MAGTAHPGDGVERLNRMIAEGLVQHLAFAVLNEEMTEADAWEQQARNKRARKALRRREQDGLRSMCRGTLRLITIIGREGGRVRAGFPRHRSRCRRH